MFSLSKKQIFVIVLILIVLSVVVFGIIHKKAPVVIVVTEKKIDTSPIKTIIGYSVEKRKIEAYSYGSGATHLAFVGGIHGGYEWNSVLLAYMFMDYLSAHPEIIPKNLTIDVIPSANPDGVYKVTNKEGRFTIADVSTDKKILASGRFNANDVDLNRNFDCKWQPESKWQSKTVSAGTEPFSEPEAKAIRGFMIKERPSAVIFWHSQSNSVYASQCQKGILPETLSAMNVYSQASEYTAKKTFSAYETSGTADDWLSSINIPAFTVELQTHQTVEWERNLAGIKALIKYYERQ